tara:strand:- start:4768 stop:4923 length:156 start_codon:yes stop_codon:yes gene_type:complete
MVDILLVDIHFDLPFQMYLHKIPGLSRCMNLDLWRAGILLENRVFGRMPPE